MKRFAELIERLDAAASARAKTKVLRAHLVQVSAAEAEDTLALLDGRDLARTVSPQLLARWVARDAHVPEWLFAASREITGELAETAVLLGPETPADLAEPASLATWRDRLRELATLPASRRRDVVLGWWRGLHRRERAVLGRLLAGDLRARVPAGARYEPSEHEPAQPAPVASVPPAHTVLAVLVYAEPHADRRAVLLSELTLALPNDAGELVPIARASIHALADEDARRLDRWIRAHATARYGPVRHLPPAQVLELGFDAVEVSARHKSGLVLEAPRILRWREELEPSAAPPLASLRAQAGGTTM